MLVPNEDADVVPAGLMVSISLVTPVYSGERYLKALAEEVDRLRKETAASRAPYSIDELIFVDDDAVDGSAAVIDDLASAYPWLVALHLSRNSGQHAATAAGILHTSGDWIVTLDEDLQHPPSQIPAMLRNAVSAHADIVYGHPEGAVHQSRFRDLGSKLTKKAVSVLTNSPTVRDFNSFRLIRGSVGRAAASVCSHDTYLDVALGWFSRRVSVQTMALKDERFIQTGRSGYRLRSLLSHARRLLMSSQIKFLRLGGYFGFAVALLSALFAVVVFVHKVSDPAAFGVQGWASTVLLVSFLSGSILVMLSIVLEYLNLLAARAHGRPLFFVIDRRSDAVLRDYFAGC